ncbi:sugar kinase [Sandaracinobacter sp. RS1-74]|uniref:carbohydrate kinase family protein n=1 Tax=Sandaracinobacteroides sayramensis TaxID=2913411 RepID=UPI001EDB26FB|nr:sugar kinase [Sandaracinobacteroides sayramensis]MCG2841384.1 sugar kinase [Sandaracinobacteroides sayramensis]
MEKTDLLAVGLTTLDISVRPVEALPAVDEGTLVENITLTPAGTAAAAAAVGARLGLKAALASAVGNDLQGEAVRSGLEKLGVDTSLLATDPTFPTSTTLLPVRADGQRSTLHMVGASVLSPVPEEAFARLPHTRAVHWGGIGYPGPQARAVEFLQQAKANGAFVTCDLISPSPSAIEELATLLPHVDLFMPSLAEVQVLTGSDDLEAAARRFMALGAGGCAFKLGRSGATLFTPGGQWQAPAFRIDPVDTTSCGDSFCAGFIAARLRGFDEAACLRFAVAVSARVALGLGTLGGLESFDQTLAFADSTPVVL